MVSRRTALMTAAAVATTPIGVAGCGGGRPSTGANQPDRPAKVGYVTGFGTFGREAYAWVAKDKGYFADAGIEVTIVPGAAGEANLNLLRAGRADFAVIDYSGAVVRAGTGKFHDMRCVAALAEQTQVAIMGMADRGIRNPADLAGRKIGQAPGAVPKTLFPAYARLAGFDPTRVQWLEALTTAQLPAALAAGRVDAIGQFPMGLPAVQAAAGKRPVTVLPYSRYITDLYGNVLITSTRLLDRDPGLVSRFATALLKGLTYAVQNPDESGRIMQRYVPTTKAEIAAQELTILAQYVSANAGTRLGNFDKAKVARGIALIRSLGLIPDGFDPSEIVDPARL
ncbi:MAG: ABC transporter substrate-binding protein [Micromonosporaceae bacterium]|nr:ABC transporter substrate-binding protein [Micromonosporaceae bacterium]